jgi:hypothetical protein
MNDLAEMAHMVNTASAALKGLVGRSSGTEAKLKLIRSIMSDITAARLRGASYSAIAKAIGESTGIKISTVGLRSYMKTIEEEEHEAAKKISRNLAEKAAQQRQ